MAEVGSWGDIPFDVYADVEWFTYRDFSRETKARVVCHDVLDKKQKQQVTGRDLDQVKMKVQLDGRYCDVDVCIELFRTRVGEYDVLLLGGEPLGFYTLEQVGERRLRTDGKGRPIVAELDLSFKEYR